MKSLSAPTLRSVIAALLLVSINQSIMFLVRSRLQLVANNRNLLTLLFVKSLLPRHAETNDV